MQRKFRWTDEKPALLWILAFLSTLAIAVYQRMTGPSYPIRGRENVSGRVITYKWVTSHEQGRPLPVGITVSGGEIRATLFFKRHMTRDEWSIVPMLPGGEGTLVAAIPGQPAAAKVEYLVRVRDKKGRETALHRGKVVVSRFRGNVPTAFLLLHVVFMFLGICLAIRTGLEALKRAGKPEKLILWTLAVTFIGGMILGPIVQKYAFGAYWTGFPAGTDLTDNKTLLAFIFWLMAFLLRNKSRWWAVAAAILMIIVYLIPHSVAGSELDYASGRLKNVYTLNPESGDRSFIFSGPNSGCFPLHAPDLR